MSEILKNDHKTDKIIKSNLDNKTKLVWIMETCLILIIT